MQAPDVLHIPMELASKANVQLSKDVKVASSGTPQLSRLVQEHPHNLTCSHTYAAAGFHMSQAWLHAPQPHLNSLAHSVCSDTHTSNIPSLASA